MVYGRTGFYPHQVTGAALLEEHVPVARGNQSYPEPDGVAVARFTDFHLRDLVKSFGKARRELFGHMLDNQRAWGSGWQIPKDGFDRLCSAR